MTDALTICHIMDGSIILQCVEESKQKRMLVFMVYNLYMNTLYLHGRHLYAISMNFVVSGQGSWLCVREAAINLQWLFFWHASTMNCSNEYWKETTGDKMNRLIMILGAPNFVHLQQRMFNSTQRSDSLQSRMSTLYLRLHSIGGNWLVASRVRAPHNSLSAV